MLPEGRRDGTPRKAGHPMRPALVIAEKGAPIDEIRSLLKTGARWLAEYTAIEEGEIRTLT